MSDTAKAVFLSYASQDAAAAQRICAALREADVEVWFDQSELVGGDAWDAKIRGQIKTCALFVPLISANTNARREGYFRREWKLAVDRTHDMDEALPFLLPIVIDDTTDAGAFVPEKFREVQWTRLLGGETPEKFCTRVKNLLGGSAVPAAAGPSRETPERGLGHRATPESRRRVPAAAGIAVALVVAAVLAASLWLRRPASVDSPDPRRDASATTTAAATPVTAAQKLLAQARQAYEGGDEINRENLALSEELVQRSLALDPADAAAWEFAAWLSYIMVWHSIDESGPRREKLLQQANRAVALAPDMVSARLMLATARLGTAWSARVALNDTNQLDEIARELVVLAAREPRNWKIQRALGTAYRFLNRTDDAIRCLERAIELSGEHPMASADLFNVLLRRQRYAEAEPILARALLRHRTGRLLTFDVTFKCRWQGDTAGALQAVETWPGWLLKEDRGVAMAWQAAYWGRQPAVALRFVSQYPRDTVRDMNFSGPRAVLFARAHELAGNTAAAQSDWQAVVQRCEQDLATNAQDVIALYWKAWAQARLGARAEAQATATLLRQRMQSVVSTFFTTHGTAALWATVGWNDAAFADLQTEFATPVDGYSLTRAYLELEPAFDPLRADPRFKELLARAPAPAAAQPPPDFASAKSVAVLAFANLSDDKANEYFSDGISEELLNVLAKVPGLKVSARTSAFHFKGKDTPIPEIARQLGVAYVVEGSVRRAGTQLRISARLLNAADGKQVWADDFREELKDVFALQDKIAGLIAQNLRLKLADAPRAPQTVNPNAFNLYLEARQYVITISVGNLAKAEALFRRALEIDPEFTRAAAALVEMRATSTTSRCVASRYLAQELSDIERAARDLLRRDPALGEAHAALGLVLGARDRGAEAETEFGKARDLGYSPEQWTHQTAFGHFQRGRPDLAIAAMEEARRMNPLAWTPIDVAGLGYLFTRRYAKATEAFQTAAKMAGPPVTSANLALALIGLGRKDEALVAARQALAVPNRADWQPEFLAWSDGLAAWALAQAGVRSEAEAIVRRLLDGPVESRHAANYALTELGRVDEAAPTLEDMGAVPGYLFFLLNERPALLEDARFAPVLTKLRAEEAFAKFRRVVAEQADKK